MKTPQQEIIEMLIANSGNRITTELIAGMQVRMNKIFEQTPTHGAQPEMSNNSNDQQD